MKKGKQCLFVILPSEVQHISQCINAVTVDLHTHVIWYLEAPLYTSSEISPVIDEGSACKVMMNTLSLML